MTTFGTGLNADSANIKTSSTYGDRGDGVSDWFEYVRDANIGAKADAGVTGGGTTGSLIALVKGLQTALGLNTDTAAATGNGFVIALLKALRDAHGQQSDAAVSITGSASIVSILKAMRDNAKRGGHVGSDATFMNASSGNVAAAAATATLTATASVTGYLTGFSVTGAGATAASVIAVTITGLLGGTMTYNIAIPAGATVGITPLIVSFDPPLPASAANTAIVVSAASFGAGNTNAAVNAHGYKF